jgi:uncharacterized protein YoxC
MLKWIVLMVFSLSACGTNMEEVKQEILPKIENNQRLITSTTQQLETKIETLRGDVKALEVTLSTLRDRIWEIRDNVLKELSMQNMHLLEINEMQLSFFEKKREYLQGQLKTTMEAIEQLKSMSKNEKTAVKNNVKKPTRGVSRK